MTMTMTKALAIVAIGTMLLGVVAGVVLVSLQADGTAYALTLALVLSAGGFVNYLATIRYGSARHPHR